MANSATSLFAGFVIFTVLGNFAHEQSKTVEEVAQGGWQGLTTKLMPCVFFSCT